ncbi:hypothetical protein HYS94_00825 [Candidatus Daviesbacteria bacterium]|nr:hypothetical protein [Candidatus Daviesbacteria bacterium]
MFEVRGGERAFVYDYDDTVFDRGSIVRGGSSLKTRRALSQPKRIPSLNTIPVLNRQVVDAPIINPFELISFLFHRRRGVFPQARDEITKAFEAGIDIFGNTGRLNKKPWVNITDRTLERGGIRPFLQGSFFTPVGVRVLISKIDALREVQSKYEVVDYFEDDEVTARGVKLVLPEVNVHIVRFESNKRVVSDLLK